MGIGSKVFVDAVAGVRPTRGGAFGADIVLERRLSSPDRVS